MTAGKYSFNTVKAEYLYFIEIPLWLNSKIKLCLYWETLKMFCGLKTIFYSEKRLS